MYVALLCVSMALQFVAVLLAARLAIRTSRFGAWGAFSLAFLLFALHHSMVLYGRFAPSTDGDAAIPETEILTGLAISVLAVAGLALMGRKQVTPPHSERGSARRLLDQVSDWTWETDRTHRFVRLSDGIEAATGKSAERLYGLTLFDVHAGAAGTPEIDAHLACIRRHEPFVDFVYRQPARGRMRHFEVSGVPKFDAVGRFDGYLGAGRDVTEIVESRAEAERSRRMLADTLDGVAASITVWDPDDRLVLGNRMFNAVNADIAQSVVPGTRFEDFIRARYGMCTGSSAEMSRTGLDAGERRLREHGNPDMAFDIDLPGGDRHLVRECRLPDGSTVIVGVDITELRKSEEKLRQSQTMMSSILDALPLSVTMVDERGHLTYVNRFEQQRWGYDPEKMIGANLYELLPPQIAEKAREEDQRVIETGRPIPFFEERARINGRDTANWIGKIPIERPDAGVGVCMIGLDITDRVDAMDALHDLSTGYRRTLELFPEAVYVSAEGNVVFANDQACRLFRAPPDRGLDGYPSIEFYHASSHDQVREFRRMSNVDGELIRHNRHRFVRLDGSEFEGELKVTTITWDGGPAALAVVRDVTAEIQRSEELETARLEADRANIAKSDFLASMSHEIRTPLNGVLGMTNLLIDSPLTPEQRKQVETVRASGNLLLSLLNDILDLSKIEAGKLELENIDFDLSALLASVSDLWAPKAEAQGLSYSQTDDISVASVLRSDPTRIRQILFNFLSNALKFTIEGEVAVAVRQAPEPDGRISTRFEVRDTGEGIAPENFRQLFQKFSQADSSVTRRHGGTGLGLAISRQLAEAMNGDVGVDSTPGEGSVFWFTIVCDPGDPASIVAEGGAAGDAVPSRPLRILVAEDNDVNQLVVRAMLEKAGHRVDMVGNGYEAVSAVRERPFDLVLMDVQMPEMDGVTATRRIRSLPGPERDIPVIALTANAMKGDREKYIQAGMDDYVSKPIDPHLLNAALRRRYGSSVAAAEAAIPVPPVATDRAVETAAGLKAELTELFGRMDGDTG